MILVFLFSIYSAGSLSFLAAFQNIQVFFNTVVFPRSVGVRFCCSVGERKLAAGFVVSEAPFFLSRLQSDLARRLLHLQRLAADVSDAAG